MGPAGLEDVGDAGYAQPSAVNEGRAGAPASDQGAATAANCATLRTAAELSCTLSYEDLTEALDLATAIEAMTGGATKRTAARLVRLLDLGRGQGAVIDLDTHRRR